MPLKLIGALLVLSALCSCSLNKEAISLQKINDALPTRTESVSFFSQVHKKIRDTERASYDLMYGIRDGVDSFVYDVQKDYYEDYQQ